VAKLDGNRIIFLIPLRHDPERIFSRKFSLDSSSIPLIKKAVQGINGSGTGIDYRNQEILAAWQYLPDIGWGIVVKIDAAEALAMEKKVSDIMLWIAYLTTCSVILASLLIQ